MLGRNIKFYLLVLSVSSIGLSSRALAEPVPADFKPGAAELKAAAALQAMREGVAAAMSQGTSAIEESSKSRIIESTSRP